MVKEPTRTIFLNPATPFHTRRAPYTSYHVQRVPQCVDRDHCGNVGLLEGSNDQLVHLIVQGLMGDSWIRSHQWGEEGSNVGILARELDGEVEEYEPEVASVRVVPQCIEPKLIYSSRETESAA